MHTKISRVKIKGFKSHINSEFNYASGLTVVTGPTDSGKSAGVMQPVKWVVFGEPSGEAFIFTIRDPKTKEVIRQAEAIEVEVQREDGLTIVKTRRKGKTAYYINGRLISEKAEVPEEVKEALGLSKQTYGDFETSLNFAYQLEAPFILSETASVGAKVLGKLAGTEIVDKAIAAIMKRTYKAREDKNTAQKIIDQANVELIEFLHVDDILAKVQTCEVLLEQLEADSTRIDILTQLTARYSVISDRVQETEKTLERLAIVPLLVDILTTVGLTQERYCGIQDLYHIYDLLEATKIPTVLWRLEDLKNVGTGAAFLECVETDYARYNAIAQDFYMLVHYQGQQKTKEEYLDRFKAMPEVITLLNQAEHDDDRLGAINDLYTIYYSLTDGIEHKEAFLKRCQTLGLVHEYLSAAITDSDKLDLLNTQVAILDVTGAKIGQLEARIDAFKVLPECESILSIIDDLYGRMTDIKQLMDDYSIRNLAVKAADLATGKAAIARADAEQELTAAWTAAGDICPLCEQPGVGHNHE